MLQFKANIIYCDDVLQQYVYNGSTPYAILISVQCVFTGICEK